MQDAGDRDVIHFVIDIPIDQRAQDRPTLTPVSGAGDLGGLRSDAMKMTKRDLILLAVIGAVAILGGFYWFASSRPRPTSAPRRTSSPRSRPRPTTCATP